MNSNLAWFHTLTVFRSSNHSRPSRSQFNPSSMAHVAKTVPRKGVTRPPPTPRQGRISKTNARDKTKAIVSSSRRLHKAPPSSRSRSSAPLSSSPTTPSYHSRPGSDALDRLATIFENRFENVGRQIRQSNHSTFEQLVEHLDDAFGIVSSVNHDSRDKLK
jgi:hypothetical protein